MIENLSSIQNFNKVNPFSRVDTANGMPINNYRMVEQYQIVLGQKSLSQKKILEIYTRSFAFSNGDNTNNTSKQKTYYLSLCI